LYGLTGYGKTWLVCFVYLVDLVYLVSFVQPNKPERPNRPNEQDKLADFFSILLEEGGYDVHNKKVFWDRPAR
jgi:hypothetical protein